jgi:hypothetical protein
MLFASTGKTLEWFRPNPQITEISFASSASSVRANLCNLWIGSKLKRHNLRQPLQHFFFTRAARAADDVDEVLLERDWTLAVLFQTDALSQFV